MKNTFHLQIDDCNIKAIDAPSCGDGSSLPVWLSDVILSIIANLSCGIFLRNNILEQIVVKYLIVSSCRREPVI